MKVEVAAFVRDGTRRNAESFVCVFRQLEGNFRGAALGVRETGEMAGGRGRGRMSQGDAHFPEREEKRRRNDGTFDSSENSVWSTNDPE